MLIEDDSERGENEVIENKVLDKVSINARVEVPRVRNESTEDEVVLKEEYLSKNEGNEIERMVKRNIE